MYTSKHRMPIGIITLIALMSASAAAAGPGYHGPYGFGSAASVEDIRAVDIAVGPDGEGLPPGQGTVAEGEAVYQSKCAECHGATGTEGPRDRLVGGALPVKTIGSYWPHATTIFDFIRRAMPLPDAGSLTDDEVYAITAWLLHMNKIIDAETVMDAKTLPQVRMPNRDGFVADPRPDVD